MNRAIALALAAAGAALVGCGSGGPPPRDGLVWQGRPLLFRAKTTPRDRVLIGTVKNASGRKLTFKASGLSVRDAAGRRLRSYAQFTNTYAHGIYGALQKPRPLPPEELQRLGIVATIPAGKTAPLYVAFRLTHATRQPLRVRYERGSLSVPRRSRPEA